MIKPIKAPMPYFGGKSAVAGKVWERLGNVPNYVEPFFGSGAVLLARPHAPEVETVNDMDGFLVNMWRSLKLSPEETARHADWIVSEQDLEARHYWLVTKGKEALLSLLSDPEGHCPKIAGWWLWGACCWIGSGWCAGNGPWRLDEAGAWVKEERGGEGRGVGVKRVLPHLGNAGRGIRRQLPHLGSAGMGVRRQLPHLGDAGRGDLRPSLRLLPYFSALSQRLDRVRVAHGDFERVLGESVTIKHGLTGVFLDPPYISDCDDVYTHSDTDPARRAAAWARENGANPLLRIALCGYEGEHDLPGWNCVKWKASGGYAGQGKEEGTRGKMNRHKESIWFSPHCLKPAQGDLFGEYRTRADGGSVVVEEG